MREARHCARIIGLLVVSARVAVAQSPALDARSVTLWARLLAVHDARRADSVTIDEALASPVAPLRAAAARVIGLNRIASRYGALRTRLVAEPDTAAARDAAFALGVAADSAGCGALRQALARPDVQVAAAGALGEIGASCGAFAALLGAASSSAARAALLRAAGRWAPFPDSVVVDAYHAARRRDERWAALYVLGRSRRPAGAALARAASRDVDAGIREAAARLLTASLAPDEASRASANERLAVLLRDQAPHVRIAALRALATHGPQAMALLDATFRRERDTNVRIALAQVLVTIADSSSPAWAAWWHADTMPVVRGFLLAGAWQAGAVSTLPGAASFATARDPRLRIAMLEGGAARNAVTYAPDAALRLTDADARVRIAAFRALMRTTGALRDTLLAAHAATLLTDSVASVREAVLLAHERTAAARDVPMALAAYTRAGTDTSAVARNAALLLVASAWRRDSLAFDSTSLARLRDVDAEVDARLWPRVTVGPGATWRRRDGIDTTLARYEEIVRRVIVPALAGRTAQLRITTARGVVRITLDGVRAPMTVDHLSRLAERGYFTAMQFHRVVPAFVAQTGDPRGDGSGGPGVSIRDELNRLRYTRGAVGMALSGPDTGGSQFFLTLAPQPHLDGHYTMFGRVRSGSVAMDALVQGDRMDMQPSRSP